jgi:hypothetical protein
MTYIFVLAAGALLPPILALYGIEETWIWRAAAVIFAVPMLSLQFTYPRRRLHHGVDHRLLHGHFRLSGRARCDYAAASGKLGAAGGTLGDIRDSGYPARLLFPGAGCCAIQ